MNIVTNLSDWQQVRNQFKQKSIGFVPTMGNLHQGHASLCQHAKQENDLTVVSIFVNPAQFNQTQDFEFYPRTIDQDIELLTNLGIDYLLMPSADALYPDDYQVQVAETELSTILEGKFRPGHFTGMLTVVLKLLNLVRPNKAYFGEKDYQQLLLVKKMVAALFLPVDIVPCPTVRNENKLALSSRNARLTKKQHELACQLPHLLKTQNSLEEIKKQLESLGFEVEYIAEQWQRRLAAVWLGDVRLIDNIPINTTGELC